MKNSLEKQKNKVPEREGYESPEWARILLNLIYLKQKCKEVGLDDR